MPKYLKECTTTIPSMVANGQIKYKEEISYGLEKVGDALLAVQSGANKGKSVVVVAEK
jgi:NADPH-dependent curcumin reductase CurA